MVKKVVYMSDVGISRGALLLTLAETFAVPHHGLKALTARVRLLGILGVPRQRRSVAHVRLNYGLLEVIEIASALVLMNAHMPPVLAARHVRDAWGGFVRLALAAIQEELPQDLRPRYSSYVRGTLGVIRGNVLITLGARDVREAADELPLATLFIVANIEQLGRRITTPSSIVIDTTSFVPALFKELRKHASDDEELQAMLDRLRDSASDTLRGV